MRAPSFLASLIAGAVLSFSGIAHAQSEWDPRPYERQLLQWNISLNRIHEDLMGQMVLFLKFLTDNQSASPTELETVAIAFLSASQNAQKLATEILNFKSKVPRECISLAERQLILESARCFDIETRLDFLSEVATSFTVAATIELQAINSLRDGDLEEAELLNHIANLYRQLGVIYMELERQRAGGQ
ncbi:hypothetical protein [Thermus thermophilus]|nr:hypothetical protein [Thermus thermophilus]